MAKKRKKRYYRKRKQKTTYIYEIRTSGPRPYFYIGKANNPWSRLEVHKHKALDNIGPNVRKNRIFRQNLRRLKMKVIEKPKMKDWREREIHHIAKYRRKYGRNRVLNLSDGGDGASGGGHKDKGDKKTPFSTTLLATFFVLFGCYFLYLLI